MKSLIEQGIKALAEIEGASEKQIIEALAYGCEHTKNKLFNLCAAAAASLEA